jgi:hypothetical protein
MSKKNREILAWQDRISQLAVAGWGAALLVFLTLSEESWIGRLLVRLYTSDEAPPDFLQVVGGFVATSSVGLVFSALFLIAEEKTRNGWGGLAAIASFSVLVLMIAVIFLNAIELGPA